MTNKTYEKILKILLEKTKNNKVMWQKTMNPSLFLIYFLEENLSLRYQEGQNDVYNEDGNFPSYIQVTLRDAKGEKIDSFEISETSEDWDWVFELYSEARRKALGIDKALNNILTQLQQDQVGGSVPVPDDDLPF